MADEAVESIAELRPVVYTAKHYALFLQKILNKTSQLNKGKRFKMHVQLQALFVAIWLMFAVSADGRRDWTPHRVEQCLWAWAVANQIQPSLVQVFRLMDATHTVANQKPEKRKTANEEPSKRQKTERSWRAALLLLSGKYYIQQFPSQKHVFLRYYSKITKCTSQLLFWISNYVQVLIKQ